LAYKSAQRPRSVIFTRRPSESADHVAHARRYRCFYTVRFSKPFSTRTGSGECLQPTSRHHVRQSKCILYCRSRRDDTGASIRLRATRSRVSRRTPRRDATKRFTLYLSTTSPVAFRTRFVFTRVFVKRDG